MDPVDPDPEHWLATRAGECILPLGVLRKLPLSVGHEGGKLRHLLTYHLFVVTGGAPGMDIVWAG